MPEKRKYCQGECGTILWDLTYQPHRKFCNSCNDRLALLRSNNSYHKNHEKYNQRRREKYQLRKLEVPNA